MIANETGVPVWRHMMSMEPQNAQTYNKDMQAYVGDEIIIAPYYPDYPGNSKAGARTDIYLPGGTWYDFFEGTQYTGPQGNLEYLVDPDGTMANKKLPMFVKAGAIIPMMEVMQYIGEKPEDLITLNIWPSGISSFNLYEDEKPTKTSISCAHSAEQTIVTIGPFAGSAYCADAAKRKYTLEVHTAVEPQNVASAGTALPKQATLAALESAANGWFFENVKGGIAHIKASGDATAGFDVRLYYTGVAAATMSAPVRSLSDCANLVLCGNSLRLDIGIEGGYDVEIMDMRGKLTARYNGNHPASYALSRGSLAPGMYTYRLSSNGGSIVRTFLMP
jgi:hypothetical protein